MSRKKDSKFWESALRNNVSFRYYYDRLIELSVSMFEWKNVPDTIDVRYLELALFNDGKAVFFYDEELGYLTLRCAIGGRLNVYNIPMSRRAYASNGYNKQLSEKDSVIIYNNYLHTNSRSAVENFATELSDFDRTVSINVKAQKTPILIQCDDTQKLTLENAYMQYIGNQPVIFAYNSFDPNSIKVWNTNAPYIADKVYVLKTQMWNEALTYLGISNINVQKKERLISDEVMRNQGGVVASRYSRLEARKDACKLINKMFGLEIDVEYRADIEMETRLVDLDLDVAEEDKNKGGEE